MINTTRYKIKQSYSTSSDDIFQQAAKNAYDYIHAASPSYDIDWLINVSVNNLSVLLPELIPAAQSNNIKFEIVPRVPNTRCDHSLGWRGFSKKSTNYVMTLTHVRGLVQEFVDVFKARSKGRVIRFDHLCLPYKHVSGIYSDYDIGFMAAWTYKI